MFCRNQLFLFVICLFTLVSSSYGQEFTYTESPATDNSGTEFADSVFISYDSNLNEFSVRIEFQKAVFDPDGFTIGVSRGYEPGETGDIAMIYVDLSTGTPRLSAYAYNVQGAIGGCGNNPGSWEVGDKGTGAADTVKSSTEAGWIKNATDNDNGTIRTISFTLDTVDINSHTPAYPGLNGWNGVAFGSQIGVWMWAANFSSPPTYDAGGFLTSWPAIDTAGQTCLFYDFNGRNTNNGPTCTGTSGNNVVQIGSSFNAMVTCSDADGDNITMTYTGVPAGATATPASGTTAASPLKFNFDFTPQLADAGLATTVSVNCADPNGANVVCPFDITVPSNQSPLCDVDTSLTGLNCQGVQTNISLDGSLSNDPEGATLSYAWTTDCPTATLLNSDQSIATLILEAPGEGKEVSCEVSLAVSDGLLSASCGAPVGVNSCPLDCLGVPFGTATEDRCGVCAGDGQSCINCSEEDLEQLLLELDGGTNALAKIARSLGANHRRANRGRLPQSVADLVEQANDLHQTAWAAINQFPPTVNVCEESPFCVTVSQTAFISTYQTSSTTLIAVIRDISRRTRRLLRRRGLTRTGFQRRRRRLLRQAIAQDQTNQTESKTLPETNSSCT